VLLFPVECGEHYHEQEFLRSIIDRQLQRQETGFLALHEKQRKEQARKAAARQKAGGETPQQDDEKKLPESKEAYFPRNAPLGSARIISERTRYGYYDFYIHIPVKDETPRLVRTIRTVLGFHEHAYGYSYARIDFEGNVLQVGDVAIAPHALPKEGDTSYSDNYVYETVKAMIALARPGINSDTPANTGAIIGIEHAAWKKQRVTLSREQNRLQFARPSRKIATVLGYKAPQVGLPRPLDRIVSPKQCSACSVRRDASLSNIYPKTERCPTCGSTKLEETGPGSGELQCEACASIWQEYEPWFVCPSCGHRQMARLNTAIVVAQSTLTGFVTYYKAVADKQANEQQRSKSDQ
jgi:transcription elongation factor Elf1